MKTRIYSEHSFDVWINDQTDFLNNETDSFDNNWIVSAGDLFGKMALPADEPVGYYDEAA